MKRRKNTLLKFVGYILDYGPVLLTVFAATVASLLASQSGTTADQILQWILLILVLLSTTQLIDRLRVLRGIESKIESLAERTNTTSFENIFLRRMPNLEERLRSAKTIDHNGITLVGTSNSLLDVFAQCIERGGQVRLLIVDPQDKALEVAAKRFYKHQDLTRLLREIEHALDNFALLHNEIQPRQGFHLGTVQIVPPYSIWVIDADTSKAEIWVNLYPFRDNPELSFQLLLKRDGEIYSFFKGQFELMWQASKLWTFETPGQQISAG